MISYNYRSVTVLQMRVILQFESYFGPLYITNKQTLVIDCVLLYRNILTVFYSVC